MEKAFLCTNPSHTTTIQCTAYPLDLSKTMLCITFQETVLIYSLRKYYYALFELPKCSLHVLFCGKGTLR